jgi:hypothetical protein
MQYIVPIKFKRESETTYNHKGHNHQVTAVPVGKCIFFLFVFFFLFGNCIHK